MGSYRLIEERGRGAMGTVYLAEHILLGRKVALKLLHPRYARRRNSVARFFREARAVNRIRHPNIVEVTHLDTLSNGTPYIIMELVNGCNLREWMQSHVRSSGWALDQHPHHLIGRILRILVQICSGLAAAHRAGVVHRDLKPDNIMVTHDRHGNDQAKILDFGMVKLVDGESMGEGYNTTAGCIVGTPAYMAPEQASGLAVDARSDIYSLGAVMYELFTGQPLFPVASPHAFLAKHLTEEPLPPRQTPGGADLDPRIEAVILGCLAKSVADRYASADLLGADLVRILAGPRGSSRAESPTALVRDRSSLIYYPPDEPRRSSGAALGSVMVRLIPLALAACAAAWSLYGSPPHSSHAATSPGLAEAVSPDDRATPPAPEDALAPTLTPITHAAKSTDRPASTEGVTVRIHSTPRAEVFLAQAATPHCVTPCDVTLDSIGPDAPEITLRRSGYQPEVVEVNSTRPQQSLRVKLRRASPKRAARDDKSSRNRRRSGRHSS